MPTIITTISISNNSRTWHYYETLTRVHTELRTTSLQKKIEKQSASWLLLIYSFKL